MIQHKSDKHKKKQKKGKKPVTKNNVSRWIVFLCQLWAWKFVLLFTMVTLLGYSFVCSSFAWPISLIISPVTSLICYHPHHNHSIVVSENDGTRRPLLLTRHFIDAFSEISTSIPHFEKIPLVKDKYAQYGVRRRQIDMIDNIAFVVPHINDDNLVHQVISVKEQMLTLHEKTAQSEDGFKDAVAMIERTTSYILKELPQLQYFLEQNELEKAVSHLAVVTKSISHLIGSLEEIIIPITSLRLIVTKLVSDINIMQSNLKLLDYRTNVRLVSHDATKEENEKKWSLWKASETDESKGDYEELVLFHRYILDMKESSHFLDQTFEQSELQVQIALDHLRGASKRLSSIYTELGRSSNKIIVNQLEKVSFTKDQLFQLNEINRETINKIKTIRDDNEPVLRAISIHGYGAIGDGKE